MPEPGVPSAGTRCDNMVAKVSLIFVLHISIWGFEAFFEGIRSDCTEIWALWQRDPNWEIRSAADTALLAMENLILPPR